LFDELFDRVGSAFKQKRTMEHARELAYGFLTCAGRVTITGMLISIGKQFRDWTFAYRLFWGTRMNVDSIFETATQVCLEELTLSHMVIMHMDDTVIRKTGKKIPGTGWKRDPLGPAFHTNFIWSQRFIQTSITLYRDEFNSQSTSIPVDFFHCPSVKKPGKKATEEDMSNYVEQKKKHNMSVVGLERIKTMRERLDNLNAKDRELFICVDGSYTNNTVLTKLPQRVTLIGRVRKDAKFNYLPAKIETKGRNRIYGEDVPTPEEIRKDDSIPWQQVKGWAAGKTHQFKVKVVKSIKWRKAGRNKVLQLVIIAPLGYRNKNGGKLLYRQPAYLICTNNDMAIEKLLQAYLWRWEIEVNFREEKTTSGCGEAQVRNQEACYKVPQFGVATHAFLQLSQFKYEQEEENVYLPKAKWEQKNEARRQSTNNLKNQFRGYYWNEKDHKSFSDFITKQHETAKSQKPTVSPIFSMFYQRK
jgi:DDE superfamily endonuclease